MIKNLNFIYLSTDEPLSNVTNCKTLILSYHRRDTSYSRYTLAQIETRIDKAKAKNKRKIDEGKMLPDEVPITNEELPREVLL